LAMTAAASDAPTHPKLTTVLDKSSRVNGLDGQRRYKEGLTRENVFVNEPVISEMGWRKGLEGERDACPQRWDWSVAALARAPHAGLHERP